MTMTTMILMVQTCWRWREQVRQIQDQIHWYPRCKFERTSVCGCRLSFWISINTRQDTSCACHRTRTDLWVYWFFTSCQLLALQESDDQDQMKTCPKCESFIFVGTHCQKCEEDFRFSFGIKASRNKKQEQLDIRWQEKPNDNNCGRRKIKWTTTIFLW